MKNKIICIVADNFELDAIHLVHQWASSNYEMTYLLPTEDPSQHLKNCKVSHTALYGHLKSFYLSKDFDLSEISLTLSTYEAIIFVGISTTFSFTFWNVAELSTIPKMVWITEKKADRLHLHQNTRQYLHSIVRTSQKIFVTHPNVQSFLSGIEEKQIPIILPIHTRNIVFFDELQRQQIRQNNKYTCTNVVIFAESSSDDFTYLSFCLESFYLFWIKNPQSKLILHGPCATNPVLNYMIQSLGCQEAVKTVTSITHAEKPPYYSASDLAVVYNEPSSADSPILFDGSVYQYYTNGLPLMVHEDSLHEYSDSLNQDMIHTFTANHVSLAQCFFKLTQALPHHCRNKQAQAFQSQVYQAIKTGGHMFVKELQSVVSVPSQEVLDHKRLHHDNVFSWIQIMEDSELESNPFNTDQETELIHFIESKNAHNLSHKILCAAGIVYMTQSRFDDARHVLELSSMQAKEFYPTRLHLAKCYLRTQVYDKAMRNFRKALAINVDSADARFGVGLVYLKLEMFDESMDHLSKNIYKHMHHQPSILALCRCVSEHPEPNKAISLLEEISEWTDQDPHILLALSQLYRKCGQADVGQILLDQALGE